ncbi:MAG: DNA-directed RNA polymerase subunit P [Candidatus Diapherotrites archaeon]|uniref:DNA-directed RNA polymerase subunit Rpo12 n=1 Tax=Candidatus Iainarchaeum sp. TaxID=3101447 RepID=A0A7J4KUS5_9ARCH|nr:MAG: hypothetical protein QT12_C0007G0007 [archaeon GW2011_AR21]MBS3058232.1 DNA-directed RNA polymerase subunit P [Candidatus Diapherotrites archaeon]HIH21900.1 DNA-directed RNA polymerase subunit P [Candidatus Diapherotrites archaeon]HIH33548.1 DNA-directed RNA polymerase subunit P [Candidatus Diapherotrites archaeon]
MVYKCGKCGTEIDSMPEGIIRCPNCANKIFYKQRAPIAKNVKAR